MRLTQPDGVDSSDALHGAIANHGFRAADRMIELGAPADVLAAAALGRMDLLRGSFDGPGRLTNRPRKDGKALSERDAIGLAMLHAYVAKRTDAVDFLLAKDGNWNMIGANNGTALHRAMSGRWVAAHYPVDLHDAVCFDLPDHVKARLDEDPDRVNLQIDRWTVPRSTALYWAASCKRPQLAGRRRAQGCQRHRSDHPRPRRGTRR